MIGMQLLTLIVLLATTPGGMQPVQPRVLTPKKHAPAAKTPTRKLGYPAVELFAVNLNERFHLRPFDDKGKPRKGVDAAFTRFLRCWHTGKIHKVDSRLSRVVYQVGRHWPGRRI